MQATPSGLLPGGRVGNMQATPSGLLPGGRVGNMQATPSGLLPGGRVGNMQATFLSIRALSPPGLDPGSQGIAVIAAMTARSESVLIFMPRRYRLFRFGTLENSKFRVDKALQRRTFRGFEPALSDPTDLVEVLPLRLFVIIAG
jgi:hypothetical protein